MNQVERLPEITNDLLSGLKADDQLKHRILLSAAQSGTYKKSRLKTVIALCSLSVLLIVTCVMIGSLQNRKNSSPEMKNIPAGNHRVVSPVHLQNIIDSVSDQPSASE